MTSKISKTQLCTKVVVLLALTGLLSIAHASILTPGGNTTPTLMVPMGTVVATVSGTIAAPASPDFTATYTTSVYRDPSNFWCANCLDFVYQFTNLGPAPNERYSMSNFDAFNVSVGMDLLGVLDPFTITRTTVVGGESIIGFVFSSPGPDVPAGTTTQLMVIETNATHWTTGLVSAQNGTAASNIAFQPTAIPEPSSLALIGSGIVAVGGFLRRSGLGKNR